MGSTDLTRKDEEGLRLQLSTSAPVTSLDRHTSTDCNTNWQKWLNTTDPTSDNSGSRGKSETQRKWRVKPKKEGAREKC